MTWLAFFFALELGWLPSGEFAMYELGPFADIFPVRYTAYTDLEAEVELFGHVFAGGGVRTSIWKLDDGGYAFWPFNAVYRFYVGVRAGPLELGFRHFCLHPVVPYFGLAGGLYRAAWEGAYEELYVRVSNRR